VTGLFQCLFVQKTLIAVYLPFEVQEVFELGVKISSAEPDGRLVLEWKLYRPLPTLMYQEKQAFAQRTLNRCTVYLKVHSTLLAVLLVQVCTEIYKECTFFHFSNASSFAVAVLTEL
jgi:hypothetical protein